MVGERPGANSRGRGGKFKKFTRGGGHHFSRDLRPIDADGNEVSMWADDAKKRDDEDGDDDEEEDEEGSDDAGGPSNTTALSREEIKKQKKARKEAAIAKSQGKTVQAGDLPSDSDEDDDDEDPMLSNPNHSNASRKQAAAPSSKVDTATEGVEKLKVSGTPSRRERESMEAAQAKERYRKLHESGKTDEAKADLARLKIIREKREAEAARKLAEKEEKDTAQEAKRAEIEAKEAKKRAAALGPQKGKGKK